MDDNKSSSKPKEPTLPPSLPHSVESTERSQKSQIQKTGATKKNDDYINKSSKKSEVKADKWWNRTNTIINGILALATIALFIVAIRSLKITENSIVSSDSTNRQFLSKATQAANAADSSFHEARIYDRLSLIRQDSTLKSNRTDNKMRYNLDSSNTKLQINTLKEQFEAENKPFLQLEQVGVSDLKVGSDFILSYTITNLKVYPVKITVQTEWTYVGPSLPDSSQFRNYIFHDNVSKYVIKDAPQLTGINFGPYKIIDSINLKENHYSIYFGGEMTYSDLANGNTRIYSFAIRYTPFPGLKQSSLEYIKNDNFDIPVSKKRVN